MTNENKISYTNPQLREFERSLIPYRGGKYGAVDCTAYLVDKGIMVRQGGNYVAIREEKIPQYDEFFDKMQKLSDLQARTIKAKQHEAEKLGQLQGNNDL